MAQSRRDDAKAARWRERFDQFQRSGLSVRDFCRQHALSEKQFFTWRRTLLGPRRATLPTPSPVSPPPAFVPVHLVAEPVAEVLLPSGLTVKLPLAADPARVTAFLTAVAAC